jgi:hypothetical protein
MEATKLSAVSLTGVESAAAARRFDEAVPAADGVPAA